MTQRDLSELQSILEERLNGEIRVILRWPNSVAVTELGFYSPNPLADRVLLAAINYVGGNYYLLCDYRKRKYYPHENFDRMAALFEKDVSKADYRRAFCRLISYALQEGVYNELFSNEHFLFNEIKHVKYTEPSEIPDRKLTFDTKDVEWDIRGIYEIANGFWWNGNYRRTIGVREPFDCGSSGGKRCFQEACVRVLLQLGNLSDAVEIASEYEILIAPSDLVGAIDEAIRSRDLVISEKLLAMLMRLEPLHPEIRRLRADVSRQRKVEAIKGSGQINPDDIDNMQGVQFEELIAAAFERLGFVAESTPKTGDFGSDLILTTKNGSRISVQCKRFKNKVNLKAVQEVVASIAHYQCDFGLVITNNSFLNSAVKLAASSDVELWDKDRLIDLMAGEISFSALNDM
jgi:HJR/Mrr/RecB family endonuclease